MRIALVAGEASGDTLGAALIEALRRRFPDAQFAGVAGPKMKTAGCTAWFESEELAVMGLAEILKHLPRLLRLRASLKRRIASWRPDVFVGIDAPEFNLGLARNLKRTGLKTVQYVSPQVWAWRQGRVRTIGESCDLVLCLLPFEPEFYREHGVRAAFVGHPLADQIPMEPDRAGARAALGIAPEVRVLALLPGSRRGEVERLAATFAGAAERIAQRFPDLVCVAPMVTPALRDLFAVHFPEAMRAKVRFLEGDSRRALAAADVVLVASGTATLETALSKRPMVVAYKLARATAFVLRTLGIVKVRHFSQPNLLADAELVPEFFQEAATPENLSAALLRWFERPEDVAHVQREFAEIHEKLRRDGAARAAAEIAELVSTWNAHA